MFRRPILAVAAILMMLFPATAQNNGGAFPRAEIDDNRDRDEVSARGVTARVIAEPRIVGGATEIVPMLDVVVGGETVLRAEGVSAGPDWRQGLAEIVEMDATNKTPEIVFSSYSGGAHCCTKVIVAATDRKGRWFAKTVGEWDGGGDYIEDADGDGLVELVVIDNAFLYAFDCYACSAAPLKILTVKNGALIDITREARFGKKHRAWLKAMESWGSDRNGEFAAGYYAGWIGQKALLGEARQAWDRLTEVYDATKDLGHDVCKDGGPLDECDSANRIAVPFPKALKSFLKHHDYPL